jgi:hypothetical protein
MLRSYGNLVIDLKVVASYYNFGLKIKLYEYTTEGRR